jgi:hypothetical protein
MKKEIIFLLMLLAIGSTWLLSCTKDPGGPTPKDPCPWPEITTEGKHTLGFKINGKEWVPCVDFYAIAVTLRAIDALMTESDGSNSLSLVGTRSMLSKGDSTISGYGINLRPLHEGKIEIDEMTGCGFNFSQHGGGIVQNEWNLPASRQGFILEILKLDTAKNIISGTFEAILLPKYGTDTLFITDGRFDVTYYPQ